MKGICKLSSSVDPRCKICPLMILKGQVQGHSYIYFYLNLSAWSIVRKYIVIAIMLGVQIRLSIQSRWRGSARPLIFQVTISERSKILIMHSMYRISIQIPRVVLWEVLYRALLMLFIFRLSHTKNRYIYIIFVRKCNLCWFLLSYIAVTYRMNEIYTGSQHVGDGV